MQDRLSWTPEEEAELAKMVGVKTKREIVKEFEKRGHCRTTVYKRLRKLEGKSYRARSEELPPIPPDAEPVTDPYEIKGLTGGVKGRRRGRWIELI